MLDKKEIYMYTHDAFGSKIHVGDQVSCVSPEMTIKGRVDEIDSKGFLTMGARTFVRGSIVTLISRSQDRVISKQLYDALQDFIIENEYLFNPLEP